MLLYIQESSVVASGNVVCTTPVLCRAQMSRSRIPAPCSSRVWSASRVGTLSFLLRAGGRLYRNGRSIFAGAPPRPSTRLVLILTVLSRVACVFTPSSFLARTPQPVCLFFKFVFFSASTGTSLGRLVFQIERKRRGRTLYVPSFLRSHSGHCVFVFLLIIRVKNFFFLFPQQKLHYS